jgi:hypothetical protein
MVTLVSDGAETAEVEVDEDVAEQCQSVREERERERERERDTQGFARAA